MFNFIGGAVMLAIMTIDDALPHGSPDVLVKIAEELAAKSWPATLARAMLVGALITLLSYLNEATNTVASRVLVAYMVGTFLALRPFDHVIVSGLQLLFGIWLGGDVG